MVESAPSNTKAHNHWIKCYWSPLCTKLRRHTSNLQKPFLQKSSKLVFEPLTWIDTKCMTQSHWSLLVSNHKYTPLMDTGPSSTTFASPSSWDVFKTLLHKHKYNVQQHFIFQLLILYIQLSLKEQLISQIFHCFFLSVLF